MKKVFLSFAVLLMGCALFTACGDDDDNNDVKPTPQPTPTDSTAVDSTDVKRDTIVYSDGAYIVCAGNQSFSINSGLTYFDYAKGTATSDLFNAVNDKSLGVTANDGLVYGSKAYLVVDGEAMIDVVDAKTSELLKQISTTTLMGEAEGVNPRRIVAKDGCIFVSTYGGYVAVIDTVNYELVAKLQAGSYPEGMAFSGKMLFVANCDYGMGTNPSISIFSTDVANKSFRKIIDLKDSLINNPISLVANGHDLYILCSDVYVYDPASGEYNFVSAGGLRKYSMQNQSGGAIKSITSAGIMTASNGKIFFIDSPYYMPQYKVLDMANDSISSIEIAEGVDIPNTIGVDPVTGDIIVAGYQNNPDTGYGDYTAPGMAIRYDKTGKKLNKFETAVSPTAVFFNTGVKYE